MLFLENKIRYSPKKIEGGTPRGREMKQHGGREGIHILKREVFVEERPPLSVTGGGRDGREERRKSRRGGGEKLSLERTVPDSRRKK